MAYQRKLNDGSIRWVVKYRDPAGKQLTKRFRTKTEATVFEGDVARRRLAGDHMPSTRQTLEAFTRDEYWPRHALTHLEQKTRESYSTNLRLRILPTLGHWKLAKITRSVVDQFVAELSKDLSPAVVHSTMATLSSTLERAVEWERIPANPARGVRLPKIPKRSPRIPTDDEIMRLADHAPTFRDRAMILTAAYTGVRLGELLALEWQDVALDDARLHVRGSVDVDRSVKAPKTHRERRARMLPEAVEALTAWRAEDHPGTLLFPNERGGIIHKSNWNRRVWNPVRIAAGLPTLRFHDLRHAYVSKLIRDGFDVLRVARWAGHSTPRMTLDVYAHVVDLDE